MCFLFSSRRRHTRWPRDWSSDVCSSDLEGEHVLLRRRREVAVDEDAADLVAHQRFGQGDAALPAVLLLGGAGELRAVELEIGRASCRERVEGSVAGGHISTIDGLAYSGI